MGNLCSNTRHCSSWSAREGALPSQRPAGSKWGCGGAGGERLGQVARSHSGASGQGWSLAGLTLDPAHSSFRIWGPPVRPHACPGDTQEWRAPSQVRGERHIDDHDAAWCGPCREGPGVPRGDRGGGSCHVGVRRDFLPRIDTLLIRILTHSLHPGRYRTHSDMTRNKPTAERRRWLTQGHAGSKLRSDKTARPQSRRSLPASGWNETGAEWRERGGRGTQGQDHGVKCSQAGQRKDSVHTTTCATPQTPGFQDSSGWVPICNFLISLTFFLFLLKKEKKKWGWVGNRGGHFSLSRSLGDSWHYQLWLRVSHNSDRRLTISLVSVSLARMRAIVKRLAGSKI